MIQMGFIAFPLASDFRLCVFARGSMVRHISKRRLLDRLIEKRVAIPSGEEPTHVPHRRKKLLSLAC